MSGYLNFSRKVYKDKAAQILKEAGAVQTPEGYQKNDISGVFYPEDLFSVDSLPFILFFAVHPTKTDVILDKIALFMPREVQVNYGINFTEATNQLEYFQTRAVSDAMEYLQSFDAKTGAAGAAVAAYAAYQGYKGGGLAGAAAGMGNAALNMLSQSNSIGQTLAINTKKTLNPHLAAIFQGVNFRRHSFNFELVARNAAESDAIKNIIYKFKYHAHPSATGSDSTATFWEWPSAWHIGLFSPAREYLYNISTCHITNMAVNYTSGGTRAFFSDTGAPVAIKLSLEFMETEVLTRDRIRQGY